MLSRNSVQNKNIIQFFSPILLATFLSGCMYTNSNESETLTVLEANKKIDDLEKRMSKIEKLNDELSVIIIAKKDKIDFPLIEDSTNLKRNDIKIELLEPTLELNKYLFLKNLDKKVYDFKRTAFLMKQNAIIYDKKGEEILLLKKGTIIESSYRVNKYFLIDIYNVNKNYSIPTTELFVSEEAFLD